MNGSHRNGLNNLIRSETETAQLLNLKEAAEFLDISEEEMEHFVADGRIPAYKIGGEFIRFKKDELEALRARIKIIRRQAVPIEKITLSGAQGNSLRYTFWDRLRNFFELNDFYILAGILIALLAFVILRKR